MFFVCYITSNRSKLLHLYVKVAIKMLHYIICIAILGFVVLLCNHHCFMYATIVQLPDVKHMQITLLLLSHCYIKQIRMA